MKFSKITFIATALALITGVVLEQSPGAAADTSELKQTKSNETECKSFRVTRSEAEVYTRKVDELVQKNFYDGKVVKSVWVPTLASEKPRVLESKNLKELSERLNVVFKALRSSHSQFMTENDEIFYFLHSMFGVFNKKIPNPKMDFVGFTAGGAGKDFNTIRYVLEGSPAAAAGLRRGDAIQSVDGEQYTGQMNFKGRSGAPVKIAFTRDSEKKEITLVPRLVLDYQQYVNAIKKSIQIFESEAGKIGYIRYWCGGQPAHDAFEEAVLSDKLVKTEGLIVDLRDGYGGNSAPDFDVLYRLPIAYPTFKSVPQSGKIKIQQDYYDKPVVVLINEGSRSGKELLAFGIKRSDRGKLVGEKTAGFFLGGRLFPLDERASIYLAVIDAYLDNDTRLEKVGVLPDIEVKDDASHPAGSAEQLDVAKKTVVDMINKRKEQNKETQNEN